MIRWYFVNQCIKRAYLNSSWLNCLITFFQFVGVSRGCPLQHIQCCPVYNLRQWTGHSGSSLVGLLPSYPTHFCFSRVPPGCWFSLEPQHSLGRYGRALIRTTVGRYITCTRMIFSHSCVLECQMPNTPCGKYLLLYLAYTNIKMRKKVGREVRYLGLWRSHPVVHSVNTIFL